MRTEWRLICAAGASLAAGVLAGSGVQPEKRLETPKTAAAPGVAVVELFTSEGCDSCPPADVLASKITREARERGTSVIVLALHVDYWDHLGWKDPFAQKAFTRRQRAYATTLGQGGGSVYTPQMVVNGATGFNGSDEAAARRAIDRAVADAPRLKVEPSVETRKPGDPVKVRVVVKGDTRWTTVSVAVVEDGLSVSVTAGENKGKTLAHDRVVRAFGQRSVKDGAAEIELALPAGVKEENCRVAVMAQDEKTMRVAGAAEIVLRPAVAPGTAPELETKPARESPSK